MVAFLQQETVDLKQAAESTFVFVDSDDIIARNTLQLVQESINQFNPDMVIFDYLVIDSKRQPILLTQR